MKRTIITLSITCSFLLGQSCSRKNNELQITYEFDTESIAVATRKPEEVIKIAQQEAASLNYDTNEYRDITVYYNPEDKLEWHLIFDDIPIKHETVGSHFSIRVDDQTGQTDLFPGM